MNYFKFTFTSALFIGMISVHAQKKSAVILNKKDNEMQKDIRLAETNSMHFIQFGILSRNHSQFKNKYCVDVLYENCVISAFASEKAKANNQKVAKFLTEKYGENWKKDLDFLPYGL